MNTTMPQQQIERKIEEMEPGESGWTVPWALAVDPNRECWLDVHMPVMQQQGGTVAMQIALQEDGWHVDITQCRSHIWSPRPIAGVRMVKIVELVS